MTAPALANIKLTRTTAPMFSPSWASLEFKTSRPLNDGEMIDDKNLKELLPTAATLAAVRSILGPDGITLLEQYKKFTCEVAGPKAAMDKVFANGVPDSLKPYLTDKFAPFESHRVVPGTMNVVFPEDWKEPK